MAFLVAAVGQMQFSAEAKMSVWHHKVGGGGSCIKLIYGGRNLSLPCFGVAQRSAIIYSAINLEIKFVRKCPGQDFIYIFRGFSWAFFFFLFSTLHEISED